MKKIIVLLAVLLAFAGTTLAAAESKPLGIYLSNGFHGVGGYSEEILGQTITTDGSSNYALGLGAEYLVSEDVYAWLEFSVSEFDPFLMGTILGVDYEFINENLDGDLDWYLRAGGAAGIHGYTQDNASSFSLTGTGVAGVNWNIDDGQIFAQLRPTIGANFKSFEIGNESELKTRLQWSVALQTGYRF